MMNPSTEPVLQPSYRDYLKKFGVWDTYEHGGKEFRRLKPMHQKFFRDILEAALSRFEKGEAIGKWNLDNIRIRDNVAMLPVASDVEGSNVNVARVYLNLVSQVLGTDGDVPDRASFYHLLNMLIGQKKWEIFRLGFESLLFHRLVRSAKENLDFVGNALEYLKTIKVQLENESWQGQYLTWMSHRKYDIKKAVQGDKYFKRVYEHQHYSNTCLHMLQFFKNLFKHANENREADGEAEWSHEDLEIRTEFYFPREMEQFYEFLWFSQFPMDFKKSRSSIPAMYNKGDSGKSLMGTEAFSDNSNIRAACPTYLATGKLQVIKNSDLRFIYDLSRPGTSTTMYYGKWKGFRVAIKQIKYGTPKQLCDLWNKAEILSHLNHPGIVAFYGVVTDGPRSTLATVTEFMFDGSLKEFLKRNDRTIDHRTSLEIAKSAAFAMEYIHEKSNAHFHLNSENFLLDMRDPQLPVCKIGRMELASVGVQGNEPWMAPELCNNTSKNNLVVEKLNVYSFGIVMWELLTREEPYANLASAEIIADTINGKRLEMPTWCDPKWRSLVERCWSANPECRPNFSDIAKEFV